MGWMVAQSAGQPGQDFDGPRIQTFGTLESLHGALGVRKSGKPEQHRDHMTQPTQPKTLVRGLGLVQSTSLNMIYMVGIGPFVVIPFVIQSMGGPQCLLAWVAGALLALFDGCIWAELGAAMPEAGGSYVFLREGYGRERWGRLMSFMYIWQTLFQAPLVIASGALGFAGYSRYFAGKWMGVGSMPPWLDKTYNPVIACAIVILIVTLLYRRIEEIGKMSVAIWVVVIGTLLWLIWGGATHFNAKLLAVPAGGWSLSWLFFAGLGHASVQTVYSYLGYYNVCHLGGEMKDPERNIPRAIFISIIGIAALYLALQTSILSVVPWREAEKSQFVASLFIERAYGSPWGAVITFLILFIAFGSLFGATLGYSRVPYAAAIDGNFFSVFGRVHPTKQFPYVSLLALGAAAFVICLLFKLFAVIRAILAMRCLIQFIGQAIALVRLRRRGTFALPFKMWFYPLPVVIAIIGWAGIFISTGIVPMVASLGAMSAGFLIYMGRAKVQRLWPFEEASA